MDLSLNEWFRFLYEEQDLYGDQRVINEYTEEGAEPTFNWMAENGPKFQTEFDNLFDGKMRVAIPIGGLSVQYLKEIVNMLKAEEYKPPTLDDGSHKFKTRTITQKGVGAGGVGEIEKEALVADLDLEKKIEKIIPAGPRRGEKITKVNKTSMSKAIANAVKYGKLSKELGKWWSTKQTLYAKEQSEWAKIEDMFNGTFTGDTETMIISRHPVDVLRMSDIGTIESCHSETGEYSYCAVAESLGNGLIAYLVNTNELERFLGDDSLSDYDDKEIFYDKDRDIKGIIAHSRVRLRKFYDQDTGEYFTAPEQRLYGVQSNTFRDSVREWSWDRQQDQFVKRVDGKKTLSLPDFDNLQRMGGSYEDTRDGETLNRFFSQSGKKIDVYRNYANVEKVLDPFEEQQGAVNVDQVQVQLDQINDQYNNLLPNVGVQGEVQQYDLDRVDIYGSAGFTFVFPVGWDTSSSYEEDGFMIYDNDEDQKVGTPVDDQRGYTNIADIEKFVQEMLESSDLAVGQIGEPVYDLIQPTGRNADDDYIQIEFDISFSGQDEQVYDNNIERIDDYVRQFDGFCAEVTDRENVYKTHELIRRYLVKEGFIKENASDQLRSNPEKVRQQLPTFKFFGLEDDEFDSSGITFMFYPEKAAVGSSRYPMPIAIPQMRFSQTKAGLEGIARLLGQSDKTIVGDGYTGYVLAGEEFLQDFRNSVKDLEDAANNFAEDAQLEFDFGPEYKRKEKESVFAGFDLADLAKIKFAGAMDRGTNAKIEIEFGPEDTKERLDKIFAFMTFLDGNPELIKQGVLNALKERIATDDARKKEAARAVPTDAQYQERVTKVLEKYQGSREAAAAEALVNWIDSYWNNMNDYEKKAAYDWYLERTRRGVERPSRMLTPDLVPADWNNIVKQTMSRLGLGPDEYLSYDPTTSGMMREAIGAQADREPIDQRVYKVNLGVIIDLDVAGIDSQIENEIRGIEEVTTVKHLTEFEKPAGTRRVFRVYEIKFELVGQQSRQTYRDSKLVPAVNRDVTGVKVVDRGEVESAERKALAEAGLGYGHAVPAADINGLPTNVTPTLSLQAVLEDWVEGGVQVYDVPMNTNSMAYHTMIPTEELWPLAANEYRATKREFDDRYKYFIRTGPQAPVYVAVGKNARIKITGGEDLVWFAKKSGLEQLPVFFSYQRQV